MHPRLLVVLSVLLLEGCAASEPKNVSFAPVTAATAPMQAGPALAPSAQAPGAAASMLSSPEAMPQGQTTPASEADIAAGVPSNATNCSTVDGVTLCDAPADGGFEQSGVGESNYTN